MKKKMFTLMFGLLLAVGWTSVASAQALPQGGYADRLGLTEVTASQVPNAMKMTAVSHEAAPATQSNGIKSNAPRRANNKPDVVYPKSYYDTLMYTWVDDNNVSHTDSATKLATDPNQIYQLLKFVYMDKRFPGPYYNAYTSDLIPTTWKLSKITTTEGHTIDFHYRDTFNEGKPLMCDIRYAPQLINDCGNAYNMSGTKGLTGYIIFPAILESIETANETIAFDTSKDYRYNPMFDQAKYALYSSSENKYDPFHGGFYNTANQFHAFFDVGYTNVTSQIQDAIQAQLASYYLRKISIVSKSVGDSLDINFSYKTNRKRKMLEGINIVGHREDFEQRSMQYQFTYNSATTIPDYFVSPATDSWGFYKGTNISLANTPSYSLEVPTDYATQADILKEIIYPTGGKTVFSYELNSYSKKIAQRIEDQGDKES